MGFAIEPLRGDRLLFITQSPGLAVTNLINFGGMKAETTLILKPPSRFEYRTLDWESSVLTTSWGIARNFLEGGSKSSKILAEENFGLWNSQSSKFRTLSNEISRTVTCLFLVAELFSLI